MAETTRRPIRPTRVALVVVVALLLASGALSRFYTEVLWFSSVDQTGMFWRTLAWRWGTGIATALVYFVLLYVNLRIAGSVKPTFAPRRPMGESAARLMMFIDTAREWAAKFSGPAIVVVSLVLAMMEGITLSGSWDVFALALNGGSFGVADAQFGRDVGFYFFGLPALRLLQSSLTIGLLVTLVLTAAAYLLNGSLRPWDRWHGIDPHVKAHLSVLAGLIVFMQAFGYWLSRFELNFSPRGQVVGASYTDVYAQLPAYSILIVIAVLSGIALIANIRFRGLRLPAMALGVWVAAAVLVGGVYPALVQQFRVGPNEVEAEVPYIERNIAATRAAFGLDTVEVREFPAAETLDADDIARNAATLENVRLWDPAIVEDTYWQLQGMRTYYDFTDVDVDRYTIDGRPTQVLISARELDVSSLAEQAQTWVNQHLVYTHGYGVVIGPVSEASAQGYPVFIVRDIPPVSDTDLVVEQPAIYFGERSENYVIANTELPEFDYPVGEVYAETSYTGSGGIAVDSIVKRLAFAMRFSAPQIVMSGYIDDESRVLYRRTVIERIAAIAPWLAIDEDPYPVILDGRIVWVVDCYTVSDRYPYSERYNGINYVRNSVKVTIDAYEGTTTLYAYDPDDPLLQAWSNVFPGMLTDVSEMPEGIQQHLRYPADYFSLQAEVYKTYHMLNPKSFYNKEDQWALPGESVDGAGSAMEPYYVLMKLPEEDAEEFMIMIPFTPRAKANMNGWMAAKSDADSYGERVVYTFPKQSLVLGPAQIDARINQDPVISQQLTLWSQRGASVIFGNLLVIPVNDSVIYVRPLYLQATETAMPQLTRVIVAYGDEVAMEADLPKALEAVFGAVADGGSDDGGVMPPDGATAAEAVELFERAIEAQRNGDWAAYGEYFDALGELLEQLAGASSETTIGPSLEETTAGT